MYYSKCITTVAILATGREIAAHNQIKALLSLWNCRAVAAHYLTPYWHQASGTLG
jgi:hypothetical protein